jgi:hypothetical protein
MLQNRPQSADQDELYVTTPLRPRNFFADPTDLLHYDENFGDVHYTPFQPPENARQDPRRMDRIDHAAGAIAVRNPDIIRVFPGEQPHYLRAMDVQLGP